MGSAGGVCYPAGSAISQIFFEMSEHCNNSACFFVEIKGASDICVTFVVYACGKSIRNICLHCGERKKPLRGRCFHALILQLYPDGGFEQIRAAALLSLKGMTTTS